MTTEERRKIGRNNKRRGASYENDAAKILGTQRYLADTGGKLDLIPRDGMVVQVKSGKRIVTAIARQALDDARSNAPDGHIGAVVLYDRSGPRIRKFIMFELVEFHDMIGGVK